MTEICSEHKILLWWLLTAHVYFQFTSLPIFNKIR